MTTEQVDNVAESPAYEPSIDGGAALDANVSDAAAAVEAAEEAGAPQSEIDRLKAELKRTKDQLAGYRGRVKEEVKRETEALNRELADVKAMLTRQQQAEAVQQQQRQAASIEAEVQQAFANAAAYYKNQGFGDYEAEQMATQIANLTRRERQLAAYEAQLSEQKSVAELSNSKAQLLETVEVEIDKYAARLKKRDDVDVDISPRRVLREIEARYKGRPKIGPLDVRDVVEDLMDAAADERLKGSKLTAEQRAAQREARREEARATGSQAFETGGSPAVPDREIVKRWGDGDPRITKEQYAAARHRMQQARLAVR